MRLISYKYLYNLLENRGGLFVLLVFDFSVFKTEKTDKYILGNLMKTQTKKIVIVGGGAAGLSAGIYARQAGFEAVILEKNTIPGGLCTAWKRNGYTIDGCVHLLMGSGKGSTFHKMWKELGVFETLDPEKDFVYHSDLFHFRFADGQEITLSSDVDALEAELSERFPQDAKQLRNFTKAVKSLEGFEPPMDLLRGSKNMLNALQLSFRYLIPLQKWKNTSIESFASKFKSRELRESFIRLWYPEYNMLYILLLVGWLKRKYAGYPLVNSLGFSQALEKKFLALDGEVRYGAHVDKVIVENKRAIAVRLDDGEVFQGDYIIHTAASQEVLQAHLGFNPLKGKNYPITPPLVHLVFGSSYDFSDYNSSSCGLQLELDPPIDFGEGKHAFILIHIYNFTRDSSPKDRTQVKVMFPSSFSYWSEFKSRGADIYKKEKERVTLLVLEALDRYFPGFSKTVDMTDVATPLTFHRYTANQEGSVIAWSAIPETPMMLKKQIKGISNLYLAGHWVMPGGGVPQAALSSRHAVQGIVMDEKKG